MITTDAKLFAGIGGALTVAAILYGILSGDRFGAIVLATGAAGAFLVGALVVGRVAPATVEFVAPAPNRASDPVAPSMWPMVTALAVVLFLVGLTLDVQTLVLGLIAIAFAGAGWLVQALRDRAPQADPAAVYADERIVGPASLPVLALVVIGVVVVSVSRILLAVSKDASTAIAIAAAAGIFFVAMIISSRGAVSGRALAGLVALAGVLLAVGGVVAAAEGEREIEPHGGDPSTAEVARGTAFVQKRLTVETETGRVIVHFANEDQDIIHNIAFYEDESAKKSIYFGAPLTTVGETEYVFSVPGPGEYFYRCEFHIAQMQGTLKVEEPAHEGEEA